MDTINFLSPSYINDLDRFLLLRKSIRRFAASTVRHVVAVPASDVPAFTARLQDDPGVTVRAQQDFVAPFFYAPPWSRWLQRRLGRYAWRIQNSRYAGRPGWIVQQIVKLSAPEIFGDDGMVIVDSDLVFVRSFQYQDFFPHGSVRTLVRSEPEVESAKHREHMRTARKLLKLAPASEEHHYMAYPTVWYGDWVRALRTALETAQHRPWQQALFDVEVFSEYLLYGVFVEEMLLPVNLNTCCKPYHIGIWEERDMTLFLQDPAAFVSSQPGDPISLVVQSNLGFPVQAYATAVDQLVAVR